MTLQESPSDDAPKMDLLDENEGQYCRYREELDDSKKRCDATVEHDETSSIDKADGKQKQARQNEDDEGETCPMMTRKRPSGKSGMVEQKSISEAMAETCKEDDDAPRVGKTGIFGADVGHPVYDYSRWHLSHRNSAPCSTKRNIINHTPQFLPESYRSRPKEAPYPH